MTPVQAFVLDFEGEQADLIQLLHDMMIGFPNIEPKIRYKIPFYYRKSWICYINPLKAGGVEFAFTRGRELSNEQGLLTANGRKQVMGIKLFSLQDLPVPALLQLIEEAILLDETVAYSVKKKGR